MERREPIQLVSATLQELTERHELPPGLWLPPSLINPVVFRPVDPKRIDQRMEEGCPADQAEVGGGTHIGIQTMRRVADLIGLVTTHCLICDVLSISNFNCAIS